MENYKKKKRRKIFITAITLCALLCIGGLLFLLTQKRYSLDDSLFEKVVAFESEVEIEKLYIKNEKTDEKIQVQEEMIAYCDSTDTIGEKTIKIKYDGFEFVINFEVKYKVEFIAKDQCISTQFVTSVSQINLPNAPAVDGYEFIGWDYQMPQELNTNLQFNAILSSTTLTVPLLKTESAIYGDTLDDITLPSNINGKWEFVDDLNTKVGSCGQNEFDVKFVPATNELVVRYDTVKIDVFQKQLEILVNTTTFVYDGEPHFPTYTLSEDVAVDVAVLFGEPQSEASDTLYQYGYVINDNNYSGYISGTFSIQKADVYISVIDESVDYGTKPQMTFVVDNFVNQDILDISLVYPTSLNAGSYQVDAISTNKNINLIVAKGMLTINPIYLNPSPANPSLSSDIIPAVYDDLLSSIIFGNAANGSWSWKTPNAKIDKIVGFKAVALFTPSSANYKQEERELLIENINKKTLSLVSNEKDNTYTYDGNEHTISYEIENGEYSLPVDGVITKINADTYVTVLAINHEFYQGQTQAKLVINKAVPQTNFKASYTKTWFNGIALKNIDLTELGEGYSWKTPNYSLDQIKTHTAVMVFTPKDVINFEIVEQDVQITINKALSQIYNVEKNYNFVYSGNECLLANILPSHYEEELTYTYVCNNEQVNELINAGEYDVTISLPESTHYMSSKAQTKVIIEKAEMPVVLANLNAIYEDTLDDVELPLAANGTWAWQEDGSTSVGTVGEQKHMVTFTPFNQNYKTVEFEASVIVSPKQLYFNILENNFVYSGQENTVVYSLTDNQDKDYTYLKVLGNIPQINAGIYNLTLQVEDVNYQAKKVTMLIIAQLGQKPDMPTVLSAVYLDRLKDVTLPQSNEGEWRWLVDEDTFVGNVGLNSFDAIFEYFEDENLDNLVDYKTQLVIKVEKLALELPTLESSSIVYDGKEHSAKTNDKNYLLYTITPHSYINAGKYQIEFVLNDSNNYIWDNGDLTKTYLIFEIKKVTVVVPTISLASVPYNGSIQYADVEISDDYTITQNGWINVGNYKVIIKLNDISNYVWSTGKADDLSLDFSISQVQAQITKLAMDDWIYSQTPKNPVIAKSEFVPDEKIVYTYFDANGTVLNDKPTDVGYYSVQATIKDDDNKNYKGTTSIKVDFVIDICTPTVTLPSYNKIYFNYNDDEYKKTTGRTAKNFANQDVTGTWDYSLITYVHGTNASYFTVTFKPSDTKNYQVYSELKYVTVHSAALINSTYYPTLETAVSEAVSGNTIYVLPDNTGKVIVVNDISIISGVTMVLLHGAYDANQTNRNVNNVATQTGDIPVAHKNTSANRKTWVTLASGKSITIFGTLQISGVIGGGTAEADYAGATTGSYAELMLCANSKIIVAGNLSVTGYITEKLGQEQTTKTGNGSMIEVTTGTLGLPFILRDFKGGAYMYAVYGKVSKQQLSPFNQYQFVNVNPLLKVNYNGKVVGYANLYANNELHHTDGKIIGNTSKDLIQLLDISSVDTNNSYVLAKYDDATGVIDLDIYGGMNLNYFTLTIKFSITLPIIGKMEIPINIDTEDVYFPVCWTLDVSLNRTQEQLSKGIIAEYTLNQKIKFLPGSKFTISQGAFANMNNIHIRNDWNDENVYPEKIYPSLSTIGQPEFNVEGELNCVNIGGNIASHTVGAKVNISNAATITTSETIGSMVGTGTSAKITFTSYTNAAILIGNPSVTTITTSANYVFDGITWVVG